MRRSVVAAAVAAALAGALPASGVVVPAQPGAQCGTTQAPLVFSGEVARADSRTYRMLPVSVPAGTGRVEVGYSWADKPAVGSATAPSTPITQSVLDLGLWDEDGYRATEGFRGWSGSRQGKLPNRIWVQADAADRGYVPGAIGAGVWFVDLGIAAVGPSGATYEVQVVCTAAKAGLARAARGAVDATHVARSTPGWYHGDFHMHGRHSNPGAPEWDGFIALARAAKLDFLPVTDYVTSAHWDELGPVQQANPDLIVWPGREIITYFGHANAIGETPRVLEYRHGFEDVNLRDIQQRTRADGALFQVNHPTIFPGPAFQNFCRGCEFELKDDIDWDAVDTIEVVTGPVVSDPSDLGGPKTPMGGQQPFVDSAVELWESLLQEGHKITAVSGSDSKGVDAPAERARKGLGSSATAVYADELSRPALIRAIRAGRAYVRTRGVAASPALTMQATTPDGATGIFGATLKSERAMATVTVTGGKNQLLRIIRNGVPVSVVAITEDAFTTTFPIERSAADEGPLGTWWRVETLDQTSLTTIGNPIFLKP